MTAPSYENLTDAALLREGLSHQMDEFTLEIWTRLARALGQLERAAAQAEDESE